MKWFLKVIIYSIAKIVFSLRYRIDWINKEELEKLDSTKGTLFLPNHPSELDPVMIVLGLFWKFSPRPVMVENFYYIPLVRPLIDLLKGIPFPSFSIGSNSYKERRIQETEEKISKSLRKGDHFLIYPAGRLCLAGKEVLGGASFVYEVVQKNPLAQVVLIRTTGLWGSRFSKALIGKTPDLFKEFRFGWRFLLKNGLFFSPRRKVHIEVEIASFPPSILSSKIAFNTYLENWYQKPYAKNQGFEPLSLVSYSRWKNIVPETMASSRLNQNKNLIDIPLSILEVVKKELSTLSKKPVEDIHPDTLLVEGLGLDSLDVANIVAFLEEKFEVTHFSIQDLVSCADVAKAAAGLLSDKTVAEETPYDLRWDALRKDSSNILYRFDTIIDIFFHIAEEKSSEIASLDSMSGMRTYRQLKLAVVLVAKMVQRYPDKYIGVLLPSSTAAFVVILAIQLAGKVPVMLNWTLGSRYLDTIIQDTEVKQIISSWKFLDRLSNVNLGESEKYIVLIEDLISQGFLWDKWKSSWIASKSYHEMKKYFKKNVAPNDVAVILYTSGTESAPKGVPLTHENIISNQRACLEALTLHSNDVILSFLPPFHSFGFTITTLLPILTGFKAVYYANPTHYLMLLHLMTQWKVTFICSPPTFLKPLLHSATSLHFEKMRYLVVGAEKMPHDLPGRVETLNKNTVVCEGYGVTECSPVITIRIPEEKTEGIGRPLNGIEIAIMDPTTHQMRKEGEPGLILVRGPGVFHGYLSRVSQNPFVKMENKTWYNTGDIGCWKKNSLILSGRMKRFVKVGAEIVNLQAVEDALNEEVVAGRWQTNVEAPSLVVLAEEKEGDKTRLYLMSTFSTSVEEVNQVLKDKGLSLLIRISDLFQVKEIPLMGIGKIDFESCQKMLHQMKS